MLHGMNASADFLLSSDVARELGVSAQCVRKWERSGRLKATRTAGGVRLFERTAVEALRRSMSAQLAAEPAHE